MANFIQPGDTPSPGKETRDEVLYTKDTLDQQCDLVLVVQDDKQFKAHRNVLSEASTFFEKLLNSDMKESKEGIVRLEMFSESLMANALEFIYTGHVQILTEDDARDLIVMADYLFLQKLKTFVEGILAQKLNISNCISTYYFSQRYQCEELLSKSKKFILANFTAVYAANREDVLNMSSKEVEMWISSDKIDVSAEEDVFKIILAWIDHDKSKRKKYFAELFRQVRLVYVSRDFLRKHVVTNDLVYETEGCLKLVKDAMNLIDTEDCANLPVPPRKSLETPVIITFKWQHDIICYFPEEDTWCSLLGDVESENWWIFVQSRPVSCRGKLYALQYGKGRFNRQRQVLKIYNLYSNMWTVLPFVEENRELRQIFVKNEDELYALASEQSTTGDLGIVLKYNLISNSWEDVSDSFELRRDVCIVANDNFIYFIGGTNETDRRGIPLNDVDRYDLSKNQWDKVADIQVARKNAHGASANGKIFVAGGRGCYGQRPPRCAQCEMYDETSDSWQLIKRFNMRREAFENLLAIEGKLYAVGRFVCVAWMNRNSCERQHIRVECYNFEEDEWETKSEIAFDDGHLPQAQPCSLRLFKRFLNFRPLTKTWYSSPDCLVSQISYSPKTRETESHCFIM